MLNVLLLDVLVPRYLDNSDSIVFLQDTASAGVNAVNELLHICDVIAEHTVPAPYVRPIRPQFEKFFGASALVRMTLSSPPNEIEVLPKVLIAPSGEEVP